jgi:hypothetical protein
VTHIPPNPIEPIGVYMNLADVKGIGAARDLDYVAIGAFQGTLDRSPDGPPIFPQFMIMAVHIPPNPIVPGNPVKPITFAVTLAFDKAGNLLADGTSVAFPE